nr:unnamed protein product [Spirometra erinaceieuropaei]
MVSKNAIGDRRPCGDYRALNSVTVSDSYPVPHFQDFAGALFSKSKFSKIDLRFLGIVNFYHRSLSHCADTILPLTSLLSGPKGSFELSADALTVFDKAEAALADATLLTHFSPDAPISLMGNASNLAAGAALQKHLEVVTCQDALQHIWTKFPAAFLAVKHFRCFLEGRDFTVFTDQKPLPLAFKSTSYKLNPLNYMS